MLGEQEDVVAPLAEGWQHEGEHGETVVEVLPESPLAGGRREVHVRGGDDPDIHRLAVRRAEPADHTLLDHLEELGLETLGQEPDLVEEERALVRGLEEAPLGLSRVREGAALVAEHLRLEERVRDGGAVDVDEGAARAGAGAMEGLSDEALPRSRLALDENRGEPSNIGGARDEPRDPLPDRGDRRTLADE